MKQKNSTDNSTSSLVGYDEKEFSGITQCPNSPQDVCGIRSLETTVRERLEKICKARGGGSACASDKWGKRFFEAVVAQYRAENATNSGGQLIPMTFDMSRKRVNLELYKTQIADYSLRHYGAKEWRLDPKAIILHYTATTVFPNGFTSSNEPFKNELPHLATQYVVQGAKVFEVLPPTVRCRGALGANHRAISIEMVAMGENEVLSNQPLMSTTALLTAKLMRDYSIPISEVYSHETVDAAINRNTIPWVIDLVNQHGSGKDDPGKRAMAKIVADVKSILAAPSVASLSLSANEETLSQSEFDAKYPAGDVEPSGE